MADGDTTARLDAARWLARLRQLERSYDGPIPEPQRRWVYAGDVPSRAPAAIAWRPCAGATAAP